MSKLDEFIAELQKSEASGGTQGALIAVGEGLSLLKNLAKGKRKSEEEEPDNEEDDEEEDDTLEKNGRAANGGDYEEEDEDPEDPANVGPDSIISNHGTRQSKASLKGAVSKNFQENARRFAKSMNDLEEENAVAIDMVPAFEGLTKSVKTLGKNVNALQNHGVVLSDLVETQRQLAKSQIELFKALGGIAQDLELIKKQPVNQPPSGIAPLTFQKGAGTNGGGRTLSKSEMEDHLTDAMNAGEIDHMTLAKAAFISNGKEMEDFVSTLPENTRQRLGW